MTQERAQQAGILIWHTFSHTSTKVAYKILEYFLAKTYTKTVQWPLTIAVEGMKDKNSSSPYIAEWWVSHETGKMPSIPNPTPDYSWYRTARETDHTCQKPQRGTKQDKFHSPLRFQCCPVGVFEGQGTVFQGVRRPRDCSRSRSRSRSRRGIGRGGSESETGLPGDIIHVAPR